VERKSHKEHMHDDGHCLRALKREKTNIIETQQLHGLVLWMHWSRGKLRNNNWN